MTHERSQRIQTVFLCGLALVLVFYANFGVSFSQGPNNRNVSVDTRVNVTGSIPEILGVFVTNPVVLSPGGSRTVECNVSIRDFNGFADIHTVNATLFSVSQSSLGAADDNNTHYQNNTCSVISGEQSGAFVNYTCTFDLQYYAVNTSWNCTAFVNDTIDLTTQNSNLTIINALLALNVTTLIDYGQLAMGDTSGDEEANVSNIGNQNINVSVRGYGETLGDGLGFVCEQGNLTVDVQHFAANGTASYAEKQALAAAYQQVESLMITKGVNASGSLNTTYWQLFLPTDQNVFGICNGTIVFQAEAS